MGVFGNSSRLNFGCGTYMGCTYNYYMNGNREKASYFRTSMSVSGAATILPQIANPSGSVDRTAFKQPLVGGGMVMRAIASGDLEATLIPVKTMSVDFTGSGNLEATASLIKAMICAMTGSGTLTASIAGVLSASVDFTGSGDLDAQLFGIAEAVLAMTGSGDLSADISGIGNMSIDIVVTGTGLSTANVGQYVWEALVSQFSANPDSAAAKLLAAGSAGDPWSTDLPASYTGTQAGAILDRIQTLIDELHKIEGLSDGNPMTVTQSSRSVGTINLDITGDGETSTTVTRND